MQGLSTVLVRPLAFSLHSTELSRARQSTRGWTFVKMKRWLMWPYISQVFRQMLRHSICSPLSSASSSTTMELHFLVSVKSHCRDTALLYLSCQCIAALGFTYLLCRQTSLLMWSQRMFRWPDFPSRLSPRLRKYYWLPWILEKVNTLQS